MLKDRTNEYYTGLLHYLQGTDDAKLTGGQKYNDTPPSFPWMYFTQISGAGRLHTLSNTEEGMYVCYQVELYNKTSINALRIMANNARVYMFSQGFRTETFRPMDNVADRKINRFVMTFIKLET